VLRRFDAVVVWRPLTTVFKDGTICRGLRLCIDQTDFTAI